MKIKLGYGVRYKIEKIEDLDRFNIPEKELLDAKNTLLEYLKDSPVYITLVGSEHNYKWIKENITQIYEDLAVAISIMEDALAEGKIDQETYDEKVDSIKELSEKAEKDLSEKVSEYDYYYEIYGNYNIIKFSAK